MMSNKQDEGRGQLGVAEKKYYPQGLLLFNYLDQITKYANLTLSYYHDSTTPSVIISKSFTRIENIPSPNQCILCQHLALARRRTVISAQFSYT